MRNIYFFIVGICWVMAGFIIYGFYIPQDTGSQTASVSEALPGAGEADNSPASGVYMEPVCENFNEIQEFENPVPVVWTAKMTGCLMSCQGAPFTRLPEGGEYEYPRFAGYYKDGTIPGEFLEEGLALKIYGDWIGIDADHSRTVFENKCVPIVEIEKIEIAE